MSGLWLFVSWALSLTQPNGSPKFSTILQTQNISNVYFMSPEIGTNEIFPKKPVFSHSESKAANYLGPNLSELGKFWFSEVTGANVIECNRDFKLTIRQDASSIFATFASVTPAGPRKVIYLARVLMFALHLRKKKIPAVVFVPDTYYLDAAIVSSLLVGLTQGATVFLQNSSSEASNFGYPNAIWPIFWTWPPSRAGNLDATPSWSSRKDICLLPGGNTGGTARSIMASEFSEQLLSDKRFSTFVTDGSLSKTEYLSALDVAKLSMTTNYVQDNFNIGWKAYRERMTDETTTGRVWEAFSRGQVLVCNKTRVLNELGFFPGVHYVELVSLLDGSFPLSRFTDSQLERIAAAGQGRFRELLKTTGPIKSAVARLLERH